MSDEWGVGDQAGAKAFGTAGLDDGTTVELIHGQHPHSRQDSNTYARFPDGDVEGFSGHRVCVSVVVEEYNYLKESGLSGNEVRPGGRCKILFDGRCVYGFFGRNAGWMLRKADQLIPEIREHSIGHHLMEDDPAASLRGKKVYWRDEPAVITNFDGEEGTVTLRAETSSGAFKTPAYRREDEDDADDDDNRTIRDDYLSKNIWWWRK